MSSKTIFQFASELSSHNIYDNNALAAAFKKETGFDPCWPVHSHAATVAAIRNRELGGELDNSSKPAAYGWEIAEALADKFTKWTGTPIMGRGGRFRAAIEALHVTEITAKDAAKTTVPLTP